MRKARTLLLCKLVHVSQKYDESYKRGILLLVRRVSDARLRNASRVINSRDAGATFRQVLTACRNISPL